MPDDNLFDGDAPEGTPTPAAEPAAAKATGGDARIDNLEQSVSGLHAKIGELGQGLQQIYQQGAAKAETPPEPAAGEGEEEFLRDPFGTTQKLVEQATAGAVKPLVEALGNDTQVRVITNTRTETDETYGEGTFDKYVAPVLLNAIGRMSPEQKASEIQLRTSINSILGQHADALYDARSKHNLAKAEIEAKAAAADEDEGGSMLTGGRRRRTSNKTTLDGDEKDFLAAYNKDVDNEWQMTEAQYIDAKKRIKDGSTDESDWAGAFSKEGAAA
jgi:hypothetical protein